MPLAPIPWDHLRRARWAAGAEVALVYALILTYAWALRGRGPAVAVVVVLVLASHAWRRETPAALGFRREEFGRCLLACAPVVALTAAAIVGGARGRRPPVGRTLGPGTAVLLLAGYTAWALVQQWALCGYTYRRLSYAFGGRRRGWAAAALLSAAAFGVAHLPNRALAGPTAVLGLLAVLAYRRHRNLLALAAAHGVLGALLLAWVVGVRR